MELVYRLQEFQILQKVPRDEQRPRKRYPLLLRAVPWPHVNSDQQALLAHFLIVHTALLSLTYSS